MEIIFIFFIILIVLLVLVVKKDTISKVSIESQEDTDKTSYIGHYMSYKQKIEYMNFKAWRTIKKYKLAQHPCCQHCQSTTDLVVHHITYERLGKENLSDLAVLCRPCHNRLHQKSGYGRFTEYPISILSK